MIDWFASCDWFYDVIIDFMIVSWDDDKLVCELWLILWCDDWFCLQTVIFCDVMTDFMMWWLIVMWVVIDFVCKLWLILWCDDWFYDSFMMWLMIGLRVEIDFVMWWLILFANCDWFCGVMIDFMIFSWFGDKLVCGLWLILWYFHDAMID